VKLQFIIDQVRVGSFQYRIRRERGDDLVSPQNYGSWYSALDFAIDRINKEKAKAKKKRATVKKRGGW